MGRGAGIRLLLARGASFLLVRDLRFASGGHCRAGAAHEENPFGPGGERSSFSSSAGCGRGIRLGRQPLRRTAEFRDRKRLFAGRIQDVRNVDGGSARKVLGVIRPHLKGMDSGGVFPQRKVLPNRERFLIHEARAKADAADMGGGLKRRDLDQDRRAGIFHNGNSLRAIQLDT